ncbi:hypothetical protein B9N43_11150 [Denitratisoma sp. DHT3]|uniref:glucosamine--fructose-6-phosphate aminotransferase n=1 Tax=Denitratisoma sp. DHT3 TaxID=1981880 RepID=UPI0011984FD3|nr:glucosamine--fructose-6-phosphate aminotransferase [Denitratisoma sp. DHT3]QDX81758.1 hypothetical protein B9N43_11150 [Denitratisoma sp. DHT3]
MNLVDALRRWPGEGFAAALKAALERLPVHELPLGGGGGLTVADNPVTVSLLEAEATAAAIVAKVGVFYEEILAGCACGDEPQTAAAYREIRVTIDRAGGAAHFETLPESAP